MENFDYSTMDAEDKIIWNVFGGNAILNLTFLVTL